ncbi:hypothetical protein JX265_013073 [Neoarthrinium moseri]|uniref:Xylanolytic transcriptional activator regulatory domain-containing protein n=1 Tax=Neoarthrinium moseri TaxID=1658444 RepID=A0A9Q0AIZ6_9PEZI|nr:hypothetical protein JX265_013073 [Neoarthrinium moseri]
MATLTNGSGPNPSQQPKAIRFVNNQGQPPQKRRRINAARKTRCAGEHPECSTCNKNGHKCLGYSDVPDKKRDSVSGPGGDDASFDRDGGDYAEDEMHDEHRQWRPNRNGIKRQDTDDSASSSRRLSESAHQAGFPSVRLKTESVDWEEQQTQSRQASDTRSPSIRSPELRHHQNDSYRTPYFRYFGPTAIVPGFKQMVVKVRDRRRSSMSATSPSSGVSYPSIYTSVHSDHEGDQLEDIPVYDPHDASPVHPVILQLVDIFFTHLGCNYPFLRRDKFPRMVQEKRVEPFLVDAVCALAARFSDSPTFNRSIAGKLSKADNGQQFANRVKPLIVETFPCPSVAAVQTCLLMAYEGFGADQDSALWMYLGCAIRMAVDLGLHKKAGVKYQGERDAWYTRFYNRKPSDHDLPQFKPGDDEVPLSLEEQKELEQERIDTFWSVFLLDRIISSGTGRPVTFRDDDYELEMPRTSVDPVAYPDPFPALVHIIYLYGRVSDVLNKVIKPSDLTQARIERLVVMEHELTRLHQKQHVRLRFDAQNFQKYVERGQGTTFILLHLWFHALIIVLHQPTLLAPLIEIDQAHELAPHSRELSMSSAKTIADILAFSNLIDAKSCIGNPFTSQPIYIAACAFLVESEKSNASQPVSRDATPARENGGFVVPRPVGPKTSASSGTRQSRRHTLLASAATQNYQACYKALEYLHAYWGGIRYILTALNQKSEGIWDCETYTREEYESTKLPRRSGSIQRFITKVEQHPSPTPGPPLAWSLTGTTNSPNSSLTLLFQNPPGNPANSMASAQACGPASAPTPPGNMIYDPIRQSLPETAQMYPPAYPQPNTSALRHSMNQPQPRRMSGTSNQSKPLLRFDGMPPDDARTTPTTPDSKVHLALPSQPCTATVGPKSYTPSSQQSSVYDTTSNYQVGASPTSTMTDLNSAQSHNGTGANSSNTPTGTYTSDSGPSNFAQSGLASSGYSYLGPTGQSMSLVTYDNETDIGQHLTSFESTDMMSWFGEYFPGDMMGLYDNGGPSLGQ